MIWQFGLPIIRPWYYLQRRISARVKFHPSLYLKLSHRGGRELVQDPCMQTAVWMGLLPLQLPSHLPTLPETNKEEELDSSTPPCGPARSSPSQRSCTYMTSSTSSPHLTLSPSLLTHQAGNQLDLVFTRSRRSSALSFTSLLYCSLLTTIHGPILSNVYWGSLLRSAILDLHLFKHSLSSHLPTSQSSLLLPGCLNLCKPTERSYKQQRESSWWQWSLPPPPLRLHLDCISNLNLPSTCQRLTTLPQTPGNYSPCSLPSSPLLPLLPSSLLHFQKAPPPTLTSDGLTCFSLLSSEDVLPPVTSCH